MKTTTRPVWPNFLLTEDLSDLDPASANLIQMEEERQQEKIILIPSESIAPPAVRQALGSAFTHIYAEGYPSLRQLREDVSRLADCDCQLALHRRYADRRFYRGTELVDIIECLAQKRIAAAFANERAAADEIFVNVQPLSGAAANNAVYEALLSPGDVVMGMDLTHGGHLTHGSPYNRSGKYFKVYPYGVNPATGRLDYDAIKKIALAVRPRLIIAGASAYPWTIDWAALRQAADAVGAYLLADISHPAGLVVAGLFPNPVGWADVTTFTTHKTICGPRAAAIITTDADLSARIDRAIFPGEQGGPHINQIAAVAVAFGLTQTERFRALQQGIVANARALADGLQRRGLKLAYGGTDTHMLLVDLNAVKTASGYPLKGDVAARILDMADIVVNKNTIPGDLNAAYSSAVRMGTTWVTQRGMTPAQADRLAELIAQTITHIQTFRYFGATMDVARGKIAPEVLAETRAGVRQLVAEMEATRPPAERRAPKPAISTPSSASVYLRLYGDRARFFLHEATTANILSLQPGEACHALLLDGRGEPLDDLLILRQEANDRGQDCFLLAVHAANADRVIAWLQGLSDGYTLFDPDDLYRKVQGPVVISVVPNPDPADQQRLAAQNTQPASTDLSKPYFIGQSALLTRAGPATAKASFHYVAPELPPRRTCLYDEHLKLKARMVPFAGWTMPVWYTAIAEEHTAVRTTAGLFDISHMGVVGIEGEGATRFLDLVTSNYTPSLRVGWSHYAYLFDPDGDVIDDIFVYRLANERYMVVINAANAEKDLAWLQAVASGDYLLDRDNPHCRLDAHPQVRDLKDPQWGDACRVDVGLQGPRSRDILLACITDERLKRHIRRLQRFECIEAEIAGLPVVIARTGYTGEEMGFEIYVNPAQAPILWNLFLEQGHPFGLKPAGLGARDSTRCEAGFPLYGHELAGPHNILPTGAGYGAFVRLHKPFFIGRRAVMAAEDRRRQAIVRFQMRERNIRMVHGGDPVVNRRGECIGYVTSCVAVPAPDGGAAIQVGMAYVDQRYTAEGTSLGIFIQPKDEVEKSRRALTPGDKVLLHEEAVVLPRFRAQRAI